MNRLAGALVLLVLLLAWEAGARMFQVSALVLPPPSRVLQSLSAGLASGYFWPHIVATVAELLLGLVA
ncbi:MAG: ABC transporter permease, partial [Ramlibacter sp.]